MKQFDPIRAAATAKRIRDGEKPKPLFTPSERVARGDVWL